MPASEYAELAARFRVARWLGETPCVVVSEASTPRQQILRATLDSLGERERLPSPALLIVGEVARLQADYAPLLPTELFQTDEQQNLTDDYAENDQVNSFSS